MNLSAPTMIVFIVSLVLAVVGLLMFLNVLSMITIPVFWVMAAAYVVLAAGNLLKGM